MELRGVYLTSSHPDSGESIVMAHHIKQHIWMCMGRRHYRGWELGFQSYPNCELVVALLHISLDKLISPTLYCPISPITITTIIIVT